MLNFLHGLSLKTAVLAAVFLFMAACQGNSSHQPELILHSHPLVDRIWDVRKEAFISRDELLQRTETAQYLLLGENHDNAVHHRYQAEIIRYLHQQDITAGVAFEMIDDRQKKSVDGRQFDSADELIKLLQSSRNSWNYQRDYHVVFSAVISAGFSVYSANYHRQQLKDLISGKKEKPAEEILRLISAAPIDRRQRESLEKEIIRSHCGHADSRMTEKMIFAQQLRDAKMSQSLLEISQPVKILIAGSGHTRNDRAVPRYIAVADKKATVLSVAWQGVLPGRFMPDEYADLWPEGEAPFDIVWFTPRVKRPDFCEEMKKHFARKQTEKQHSEDKISPPK